MVVDAHDLFKANISTGGRTHRRKDPPPEYWTGCERLLLRLSTPTRKGEHGLFSFIFINNNVKDNHSLQVNSLTI